ncbi:hypothetical protein GHK92_03645 [Nocardioides sp. dk4132]|uniref:hypothetical protein n=1 Tax=unclassified Nocardioides TaxID=2615069 RepID=UPI00129496F7|nr:MULTISPECIES: hypothetical protein [unclassified Nocardioides]MQW74956.1 hypothetical protein [Nocardioides sp. dk4132]QGA07859.1 hypothetical protein GFH29_10965 [Nocardioides sp. dk884]
MIRARTVRLVVAWIVLVLSFFVELVGIVDLDDLGQATLHVLGLTTSVLALVALARFHGSQWFAWQRANPSAGAGIPIGKLLTIAVLVGVLGGLVAPADDGLDGRVDVVGP